MQSTASQTSPAPVTAADVLGVPNPSPDKTQSAGTPGTPQTPAKDEKIAPKLQVLIEREKAAIKAERQAKSARAELEALKASVAEREAKIKEFESLKDNPTKALQFLGLNYDQVTKAILNDGSLPPEVAVQKLDEKFDSYVSAQEAEKRQAQELAEKQNEQRHTQTIDKFKGEIGSYLKENGHRYELIEFEQQNDLVYDVIDEHYNRTLEAKTKEATEKGEDTSELRGEVLTIAAAADKVEGHLEQKYNKARNLKKVQTLFAPKTEPKKSPVQPPTNERQTPKTLTNQLSATPAPRTRPLTDDDRIAKAIAHARSLRP